MDKPVLKCARCGNDILENAWEVGLSHIKLKENDENVAPAYFCLCNDCSIVWRIGMGKWLTEKRKEKEK